MNENEISSYILNNLYYDTDNAHQQDFCTAVSPGLSPSQAQPSPSFGFWPGSQFYKAQATQARTSLLMLFHPIHSFP
jgi:hypothetical protein